MQFDLNKTKNSTPTTFICGLFIIAFYYLSYRYPFKINSTLTSPTYSDTPPILQYFKYILFFGWISFYALFFLANNKIAKNITKIELFSLLLSLMLALQPLWIFILTQDTYLLQMGLFFPAITIYLLYKDRYINLIKVSNLLNIFIILAVFVEFIEVFLYVKFDRLPALGWYNSISVRFGSIWDDPNSFGVFMSFVGAFIFKKIKRNINKFIWILLILMMLVLTQSITGIASTIISFVLGMLLLYLFTKKKRYFKHFLTLVSVIFLALVLFYLIVYNSHIFQYFILTKSGSFKGHLNFNEIFNNITISGLIGFNPYGRYGENGILNILLNFGCIYTLGYIFLALITVVKYIQVINKHDNVPGIEVFYASYFFTISYLISLVNLPVHNVFPLNLLFVICVILSFTKPLQKN